MITIDSNNNDRKTPSFMDSFSVAMERDFPDSFIGEADIAVAVSGGADSMALCFALSEYFPKAKIHALTVDHGLREESKDEALHVATQLELLKNVEHHILEWKHKEKPQARIQELARAARYNLMKVVMSEHDIKHLFLGHHMDDQAETFLFRLAKGSGLDGLSCMLPVQVLDDNLILCRPLLGMQKSELLEFCAKEGVDFVNDPSNECESFARVRLRNSMSILVAEGLSPKRLKASSARFARARLALDHMAEKAYSDCASYNKSERIVFMYNTLVSNPEEIVLRVVLMAMSNLQNDAGYGARLERVENLCADLMKPMGFRKRTLGGIIFECNDQDDTLTLSLEKAA